MCAVKHLISQGFGLLEFLKLKKGLEVFLNFFPCVYEENVSEFESRDNFRLALQQVGKVARDFSCHQNLTKGCPPLPLSKINV